MGGARRQRVKAGKLAVLDAWQRRHVPAAFGVAVVRKFLDDRASTLAALIAYYAFLSLFPLLLALVSLLGLLLEDNPGLQEDVLDTALARIPIIGAQLRTDVQSLQGSGLGARRRTGRRVVGRARRHGRAQARLRRRLGRAAAAQPGALGAGPRPRRARRARRGARRGDRGLEPRARRSVRAGVGTAHDARRGVALTACRLLCRVRAARRAAARLRRLLPGVAVATAGSVLLQAAGAWYVELTIVDASETYGSFALVIGLLSWFWLGSHILLVAAEVNVVVERRLWPRALTGALMPADRRALRDSAQAARLHVHQHIDVTFDTSEEGGP